MTDHPIPICVVYLASGLAAAMDIRRFRIANWLTLSLLASGLAYQGYSGGWAGLGRGAAGAAFGFLALIVLYASGGMGAGDVKLVAGVGAWLGPELTARVLVASIFAAGLYALAVVIASGRLRETWADLGRLLGRGAGPAGEPLQVIVNGEGRRRRLVPFAAMVAAGLVVTIARM